MFFFWLFYYSFGLFLVVLLLLDVHCGLRCLLNHPLWYMSLTHVKNENNVCMQSIVSGLILDSAVFVSFFGIMSLSVPRPAKRARGSQQVAHVNPMAFGMNH